MQVTTSYMASSKVYCAICDRRHMTRLSVIWCFGCEEGLCDECQEHHSLSKATSNHDTIPIADYHRLPSEFRSFSELCKEHNERFQTVCKTHNFPCCRICVIVQHSECRDLTALEQIVQNSKSSVPFEETEHLIADILETIDQIRTNRQEHSNAITKQKKRIEEEVKEIQKLRTKENNHLDKLQDDILKETSAAEANVLDQTGILLESLEDTREKLIDQQSNLSKIKQYASDMQAFLAMTQINREVLKTKEHLQSVVSCEGMKHTKLSFKVDAALKNFITRIPRYGKLVVESEPCKLILDRKNGKQVKTTTAKIPSTHKT